jgi:NADPH2:quinone reductase
MRAYSGNSQNSRYALTELPAPTPGKTQVRIRVESTALGFVDGLLVEGRYQIKPPANYVPGGEIAGTVDSIGADVKAIGVGDRVATWQLGGGLAEHVVVEASELDVIDDGLSSTAAAAMFVDYQTSFYGLVYRGTIRRGETVLVLGASGGVGSAAVQIAAHAGCHVIAAASTVAKRTAALQLGAHATVDYSVPNWRDQLRAIAPNGTIDVVFDPVGSDTFEPAFRSLAKDGRYLVVGFAGGRIPSLPVNLALLKHASLVGVEIRHFLHAHPEKAKTVRQWLFKMVAQGVLKPPAVMQFSLDDAAAAIAAATSRDKHGKVVVSLT